MKNTFAKLFVLAVTSYATMYSYGQVGTNGDRTVESTFEGALLLVKPTAAPYRLGFPMLMSVAITNVSHEDIGGVYTRPETDDYRVSVFAANGTPVPSPPPFVGGGMVSRIQFVLKPGESTSTKVDLSRLTHIEVEGIYYLRISRRISTWDSGFIISDKVKINVVAPSSAKPEK
jgi:hypothetical protein